MRSQLVSQALEQSPTPNQAPSSQTAGAITIGGTVISLEMLVLIVLLLAQSILGFILASDFGGFSFDSGDGIFNSSLSPFFVLIGIVELASVYGVFRKMSWGIIAAGVVAVVFLGGFPVQTILSVAIILLIVYLNRASLSKMTGQTRPR